jgi:hypothetical protein
MTSIQIARLLICIAVLSAVPSIAAEDPMEQIEATIRKTDRPEAPELNGAVAWINVDKPLTIADLKGKIVLLDFWTFG